MAIINKHKTTPNQSTQVLSLTESTGVYSVTNPGGYGASQLPTGDREITDIVSSFFYILNFNGTLVNEGNTSPTLTEDLVSEVYGNTAAQSLANGVPVTFDLATLIGDNYIDAVYKTIYYNFFGSTHLVNPGTSPNLISVSDYNEYTGAKYLFINNPLGAGSYSIVEILSVNTDNTLTINVPLSIIASRVVLIGYESINYFANTYNLNKCLHNKIAKLSIDNCSCSNKASEKLYEAVMLYMAIQPNMDLGKYTKAQEIINALTLYCNDGLCGC